MPSGNVIFEFQTPEGQILEWEAPEATPKDQVHNHFYQAILKNPELSPAIAKQQGLNYESPRYAGGPNARTSGQVASDQAAEVLKGMPQAVTSVPGAVAGAGKAVVENLSGGRFFKGADKQFAEGAVAPFKPIVKTMMGNAPSPESDEWKDAAQGAGATLAGAAMPNAMEGAGIANAKLGVTSGISSAAGKVADVARAANKRFNPLAVGDFGSSLMEAVKPGLYGGVGFPEAVAASQDLLNHYSKKSGIPLDGLENIEKIIKYGKQDIWNQIENTNPAMRNVQVDASSVGDAMAKSMPDPITQDQAPNLGDATQRKASVYDKPRTVAELEARLQTVNGELADYYAKNNLRRWQDLQTNPNTAALFSEGNALRDVVNKSLDPSGGGGGMAELKSQYGNLRKIEEPVMRRNIIASQANPHSLAEQMSIGRSAIDAVAGATAGISTGHPLAGVVGAVAAPALDYAATRWMRNRLTPDSLIRRSAADTRFKPVEPVQIQDVANRDPITGEIHMPPPAGNEPLLPGTKTKNPRFQPAEGKPADDLNRDPITQELLMQTPPGPVLPGTKVPSGNYEQPGPNPAYRRESTGAVDDAPRSANGELLMKTPEGALLPGTTVPSGNLDTPGSNPAYRGEAPVADDTPRDATGQILMPDQGAPVRTAPDQGGATQLVQGGQTYGTPPPQNIEGTQRRFDTNMSPAAPQADTFHPGAEPGQQQLFSERPTVQRQPRRFQPKKKD